MVDRREINVGDTILYTLREKDRPVNPEREWKGEVLKVSLVSVLVRCLDAGYEDLRDIVFFAQVTRIEREYQEQEEKMQRVMNNFY